MKEFFELEADAALRKPEKELASFWACC